MRKTEITKNERLQLIGLMTIASLNYKKLKEADNAMIEIIGVSEDKWGSDYAGKLSDEYFEDNPNVDRCLKDMGIKVK